MKLPTVVVLLSTILTFQQLPALGSKKNSLGSNKKSQALLEKNGCLRCHFVKTEGGFIGPPLDGIRDHRSEEFITALLTGSLPEKQPEGLPLPYPDPKELMEHMRLNRSDAKMLAAYLISLPPVKDRIQVKAHGKESARGESAGFSFEPSAPSENSARGLEAYKKSGCAACHSIRGYGGKLGPNLDGIGAWRSRAYIENRIKTGAVVMFDASEYHPSMYSMPPIDLSKESISQITDFLLTLPRD